MSISDPLAINQAASPSDAPASTSAVSALRRDDFDRDVWCLMGLPVDRADINRAVAEIDDAIRTGRRLSFVTPNVNWLVRALKDETARAEILEADLSLVDGAPLVAMAKLLGVPVKSRVAGSDLFEALRRRPGYAGRKLKVFFFGGRDGAAEAAFKAINSEAGGVEAVGWHNPGFGDIASMSAPEIISEINDARPDFVLVALGAAKGQAWIEHNRDRLTAPVTAHLGAVIDFTAGGVARAPRWVQRAGLEWAWRIKEEPSLWVRYARDGMALAGLVARRLAPQIGRASLAGASDASVSVETETEATTIRLSGRIGNDGLKPVREAFRAAAARGAAVILDCSGLETVDRAFLGQLLMLEKHLNRVHARLSLAGANPALRAALRANGMNYAAAEAPAAAPAGALRKAG
ncbi:MAG: WecB/TagA/CpsF family glycosyltransferase [Parvularculaceae bacterium]